MLSCDWISIILTILFFFIIVLLSLFGINKSRVKNCCKNKSEFTSCKANFGSNFDMSSDSNYNLVCGTT